MFLNLDKKTDIFSNHGNTKVVFSGVEKNFNLSFLRSMFIKFLEEIELFVSLYSRSTFKEQTPFLATMVTRVVFAGVEKHFNLLFLRRMFIKLFPQLIPLIETYGRKQFEMSSVGRGSLLLVLNLSRF